MKVTKIIAYNISVIVMCIPFELQVDSLFLFSLTQHFVMLGDQFTA